MKRIEKEVDAPVSSPTGAPSWNGLKRTPLRAQSKNHARKQRERGVVLAEMRAEDPTCKRCGRWCHADGNERLMRSQGGSTTNKENIDLLCRDCHDWVTNEPKLAAEQGWRISRKWSAL